MTAFTTGAFQTDPVQFACLDFEVNGLYILLSDRGDNSWTFHWQFYLHQATNKGTVSHLVNEANSPDWKFETWPSENVAYLTPLLGGLKIAVLDPVLHQAFIDRLAQIPIADSVRYREKITCRVWLKEALYALDDEGYISLTASVEDVETKARNLAIINKSSGARTLTPMT